MWNRVRHHGIPVSNANVLTNYKTNGFYELQVIRYDVGTAAYKMIKHEQAKRMNTGETVNTEAKKMESSGLNDLKYVLAYPKLYRFTDFLLSGTLFLTNTITRHRKIHGYIHSYTLTC